MLSDLFDKYRPCGGSIIRTPLLPHVALESWGQGLAAPLASGEARLEALERDVKLLRSRLAEQLGQAHAREALWLAAAGLAKEVDDWLEAPEQAPSGNLERSMVRYFSRMCTRCTPFGTFAGVTSVVPGPISEVSLLQRSEYRRVTRLDNSLLARICQQTAAAPAVRRGSRFRTNSSLYEAAGRFRYAEQRWAGSAVSYALVEVERNDSLAFALERARAFISAEALASVMVENDPELKLEEALDFVDELVEWQVLEPELVPWVTADDPLDMVRRQLGSSPVTAPVLDHLERLSSDLSRLDAAGVGSPVSRYREIVTNVSWVGSGPGRDQALQVDLYKPVSVGTLGPDVNRALLSGAEALRRMSPQRTTGSALRDFAERFERRYGGRQVPLLEALDEDVGVGFEARRDAGSSPLLETLPFGMEVAKLPGESFRPRHQSLLESVLECSRTGRRELVLGEAELRGLYERPGARLPDAFAAVFSLAAASWSAVQQGQFRVLLRGVIGPSGATMVGRFCHLDAGLREQVRGHLAREAEARPDAVFAEIVHLPEGRIGNVINRPVLRDYEIPLLGVSGSPEDRQIPPRDLLVHVKDGRVHLVSARLGVEVIPRLTSAHNHRLGFLPYRFLCALQTQDVDPVGWSWGPLARLHHLPRVSHDKSVFCLEQWNLGKADLAGLEQAVRSGKSGKAASTTAQSRSKVFDAARALRDKHELPRCVQLVDGDHRLTVDFDNVLSLDSFAHTIKGRSRITLEEIWPAPEELVVAGPEGAFFHEGMATFSRVVPAAKALPAPAASGTVPSCRRSHYPGSSWLYLKLYTGPAHTDDVLTALAPVIERAVATRAAELWHFLRYTDPEFHLRLRFLEATPGSLLPALNAVFEPLAARGLLHRVQLDTYEPEFERYGGERGMALAEEVHHIDSCAALRIITSLGATAREERRWKVAALGILSLYESIGFDPARVEACVTRAYDGFLREFSGGQLLVRALGKSYRTRRLELERALDARAGGLDSEVLQTALRERALALQQLAAPLHEAPLSQPLEHIAWSYAHLFANRIFAHHARPNEFVVYDLLRRHLESRRARARAGAAE